MHNEKRKIKQQMLLKLKKTKCFCCWYIHFTNPINLLMYQTNGHTIRNKTITLASLSQSLNFFFMLKRLKKGNMAGNFESRPKDRLFMIWILKIPGKNFYKL